MGSARWRRQGEKDERERERNLRREKTKRERNFSFVKHLAALLISLLSSGKSSFYEEIT